MSVRVKKHINGKVSSITQSEAQNPFSWQYFSISHEKGVNDGIGGKATALVPAKVTSKGDDRITVASSNDFWKAAEQLLSKTDRWFIFHKKKSPEEYQKLWTAAWKKYKMLC